MESLAVITAIILPLSGLFYASIIGLFTTGWYTQNDPVKAKSAVPHLRVSVVIPARDEESHIAGLLEDLISQDYPADLTEVIIIDDHSVDKTSGIVQDFIAANDLSRFRVIKNEDQANPGKKTALTLGVNSSTGDLILVTDADCRVGPGWISSLASCFGDEEKMMVFGPVSYFPQEEILDKFQSLEFLGLMASGAGAARAGYPFMCSGACLGYRKSAFHSVNGFEGNEGFVSGDDVFLMHKFTKTFGSIAIGFSDDVGSLVKTYPVKGLRAFFMQRIRWASKSKGYRDYPSLATAVTVFTFNLFLTAAFFEGIIKPRMFLLYAGFLLLKSLADLPLMRGVTALTGDRKLMKWYLPFQLFYPFYIVIAGVISLFPRRKW